MSDALQVPHDLKLSLLPDHPTHQHAEARAFCLAVIKEFYNFDYNPDWHVDLDSLLLSPKQNQYSRFNRGAFWTLSERDGRIVATAGIRALRWKPKVVEAFSQRYSAPEKICSLWRVYVRKDRRGAGIGKWFNGVVDSEAVALGYDTMYLHATATAAATIGFWTASGYQNLGGDTETTHFDKALVKEASECREVV
jgi:GNAT superfamily N-acetyltransferase